MANAMWFARTLDATRTLIAKRPEEVFILFAAAHLVLWIDLSDLRVRRAAVIWMRGNRMARPSEYAAIAAGAGIQLAFALPMRSGKARHTKAGELRTEATIP